jgi:hypothetical protein
MWSGVVFSALPRDVCALSIKLTLGLTYSGRSHIQVHQPAIHHGFLIELHIFSFGNRVSNTVR